MTDQNSSLENIIRPDELIAELSIGRATYYDDLSHLGIKAQKDSEGKAYLTFEEAEQVRQLRSHVIKNGTRKGFVYEKIENESNIGGSIVKSEESNVEVSNSSATNTIVHSEEDIYVDDVNPTDKMNLDDLVRAAQELAARNIAIPALIITELAEKMEFDDLPEDLQEKIRIAQDAANPKKYQPKLIAQDLLKQLRMQKVC